METITLWHGTTASAAADIAPRGFDPSDPRDLFASTVRRFDVDAQEVWSWLQRFGRYLATQDDRGGAVWFVGRREAAWHWATRAPEAEWKALWAVWCVLEGRTEESRPWALPEAAAWHLLQTLSDEPAIVSVQVASEALPRPRRRAGPRQGAGSIDYAALVAEGRVPEVRLALPDPRIDVTGWEVVSRQVSFTAAAGLLGTSVEGLDTRVRAGELPPPRHGLPNRQPAWTVDELHPYVAALG